MMSVGEVDVLLPRLGRGGAPALRLTPGQSRALEGFRRKLAAREYASAPRPCLCGARADVLVARRDRYGIPLDTVLCRGCGLARSDPYLTPPSLARFYREDYRSIYSSVGPAGIFAEAQRAGRWLRRWLSASVGASPKSVFEIGCGAGGVLAAFEGDGCRTAGCDFDPEYLAFGRARGLALEEGDAQTLRSRGRAELIVLRHVLEHYRDPVEELKNLSALLEPRGLVHVELPGILSIRATYGDVGLYLQNAHVWHFCRATLDFVMSRAGFAAVAGDEVIRALYRHEPVLAPLAADPGCADRVLAELRRVERLRFVPRRQILTAALSRILRRPAYEARPGARGGTAGGIHAHRTRRGWHV